MDSEIVVTDRDIPQDVRQAVAEGRKVVAIKQLREATGLGLAHAKVIVDRLAAEHARSNPAQTAMRTEGTGVRVLGVMALLAAIFVAWRYLFGA